MSQPPTTSRTTRQVYLSGQLVPESEAKISIFDAAVLLGDSITESTRTFRHQPFRLGDHIARLFKSLKVARIDPGHSPEQLTQITLETHEANRKWLRPEDDCWIVHNISRGLLRSGPSPVQTNSATVMIYTDHMDLRGWAEYYTKGCHAVTAMSRAVPAQSLDSRVKNRSRLSLTIADAEARLVDPDAQVVLLDTNGYVAENKGGNFFVVSDGQILTPIADNCLAGISRQTVLELAATIGVPAKETRLQPYDIYNADEAFFTSTPYCMMPATKFNGLPIGAGQVGPITKRLLAAWSELVGMDIVAQAENQGPRDSL
jgi:branched-chain amino acid aminotransferase